MGFPPFNCLLYLRLSLSPAAPSGINVSTSPPRVVWTDPRLVLGLPSIYRAIFVIVALFGTLASQSQIFWKAILLFGYRQHVVDG